MISNLEKDKSLDLDKDKKTSLEYIGITLLNSGKEPAFVAGVLANVKCEGSAGLLEGYPDDTTEHMPAEIDYKNNYSYKYIQQLGIRKVQELEDSCKNSKWKYKFGIGACQWTGDRTQTVLDCYREVCGNNDKPTELQCLEAEGLCVARELNSTRKRAYEFWSNLGNDSKDANHAGRAVCAFYEAQ